MDIEDVMSEPAIRLTIEGFRLNSLLTQRFVPAHEHTGLSRLELTVLVAVTAAPSPPTAPQIGRAIGHARQAVQKAVNALQKAGLILTEPNPNHKQARLLLLSSAGQTVADGIFSRGGVIARQLKDQLGSERLTRLCNDLERLRLTLEETEAANAGPSLRPAQPTRS